MESLSSLKKIKNQPSPEQIQESFDHYLHKSLGLSGVDDYVEAQYPRHGVNFREALSRELKARLT